MKTRWREWREVFPHIESFFKRLGVRGRRYPYIMFLPRSGYLEGYTPHPGEVRVYLNRRTPFDVIGRTLVHELLHALLNYDEGGAYLGEILYEMYRRWKRGKMRKEAARELYSWLGKRIGYYFLYDRESVIDLLSRWRKKHERLAPEKVWANVVERGGGEVAGVMLLTDSILDIAQRLTYLPLSRRREIAKKLWVGLKYLASNIHLLEEERILPSIARSLVAKQIIEGKPFRHRELYALLDKRLARKTIPHYWEAVSSLVGEPDVLPPLIHKRSTTR